MSVFERFSIQLNEGAFFYEPWLLDKTTGKEYRYNKVPPRIRRAFAQELKDRRHMNPNEARMILDFVINS